MSAINNNPYNDFTSVLVDIIYGNISTQMLQNDSLQNTSDNYVALQKASTDADKNSAIYKEINSIGTPGGPSLENFMEGSFADPNLIHHWNSELGTLLMQKVSQYGGDKTSQYVGLVSSFNNASSTNWQSLMTVPQNLAKTETSMVQTVSEAPGTFGQMGQTINDGFSNIVTILSQQY
jgi:hypothetical protein